MHELIYSPEAGIDFDITWNGTNTFIRCGGCNGPLLGHRVEKCRKTGGGYEEYLVKRFEMEIRGCFKIRETINKYIDMKKKEEIDYRQDRELELHKKMPLKTSLMIGRTGIPKWVGQDFEIWKKELEKWKENDKLS